MSSPRKADSNLREKAISKTWYDCSKTISIQLNLITFNYNLLTKWATLIDTTKNSRSKNISS